MKKLYVKIDGMHCIHCEDTIKNNLLTVKNIKRVDFEGPIASISYTGNLDKQEIIDIVIANAYFTKEEYITNDINNLKNNIKLKELILIILFILLSNYLLNKVLGFNIFNMIPVIDSNITYSMLFITGLLTSIHCISMCGAINLIATINTTSNGILKKPILYNAGRITSYTIIGGLVGLVGSIISINNKISGIIILFASIIMFLMSLNMLGIIKIKHIKLFKYKTNNHNQFIIGLLNGLMPCGPLQAMQVYALTTGSFVKGALSMFLFGLGTVPLMLLAGIILNTFKGKTKMLINKIASILIMLLSITMLNRGLTTLDISFIGSPNYDNYIKSTLVDDYQVVEFDLSYDSYQDIIVQKDIPIKLIIHATASSLTGCNNKIIINKYNIKYSLTEGDNVIEFTPTTTGNITYSCWMNMIKNNIKVIDDITYFEGD